MPLTFTPIQNDIAEANDKLKALYDAYNALEQKVNSGGVTPAPVPGPSPAGPQIITLAPNTWITQVRPINYGVKYNNGKVQQAFYFGSYEYVPNSNFSSDRPNIPVQIFGYNTTPSGNRDSELDAMCSMRVELNFDIQGYLNSFEPHIFEYSDFNGKKYRALSGYFSKETGHGFWNIMADYMAFFEPITGKQYASISDGSINLNAVAAGRDVGFLATDTEGKTVAIYAHGGIGFLKVPGVIDIDGYAKVYADNNAAKADGKKPGQGYFTRINGNKVLAVVE